MFSKTINKYYFLTYNKTSAQIRSYNPRKVKFLLFDLIISFKAELFVYRYYVIISNFFDIPWWNMYFDLRSITHVYLKSNKTASFCSYQLLLAWTAVPLNLVTMQSHPHALEILDFCLVIEMSMNFRKFGFLRYPFYLNSFYSVFNFNLFCLNNLNLIWIKFLSLPVDHLSNLRRPPVVRRPQAEKRWS
jgi:hypothetical protein